MRRAGRLWLLVGLAGRTAAAAPPVTDNNYAIDFYQGVALGNTQQVGMGGAGAALIVGTSGVLLNPSAIGVRNTTDTDPWAWDYHFDFLTGKFSSDYDNNGTILLDQNGKEAPGATLLTFGIGGRYHDWAVAASVSGQEAPLDDPTNSSSLSANALRAKFVLAKFIPQLDTSIGVGVQTVTFEVVPSGQPSLFSITGTGGIAGATWLPRQEDVRIGAAIETAINGGKVDSTCGAPLPGDPVTCAGYILPDHVVSPWRLVAGGAYRISETRWNQLVGGTFRDEPSLTLAADVVVTGSAPNGYGIEAFGQHELQRSGRHVALSLRGGAEYEWLPGRLRVRAGSYWEPQRFDGVGGRLHGTFGIEVRVFEFELWGRRRGRISLTGDVASAYRNLAISIGFWH